MTVRLDVKLATLTFKSDREPHISVDRKLCQVCESRPCTIVCPAGLYVWENDQLVHNCEGCLECGSCRVICPLGAIRWRYPLGGCGVRYLWG